MNRKEIKELSTNEEMRKLFKSFGWVRLASVNNVCRSQVSSIVPARMSALIEKLRDKPEMMKMFKKHKLVIVCKECGDYAGNTANWIEHCVKSHIKTHLKTVKNWYKTEPAVPKDKIVEELSSELKDTTEDEIELLKGEDKMELEMEEIVSEIVMTLVLEVVGDGEGDGDEEYEEFLKEQEKEATGPERDQVEEKRPGKRKREKDERDQELCNVCAKLKIKIKEEPDYF